MTPTYEELRDARLQDLAVPFWAKDLIRLADDKDVLDAMYVLKDLCELFRYKYEQVTGRASSHG